MSDKPKLMIVDDEKDNLDLLYRTLRRDFQVFRADSPLAGFQILETEGEMAIIISDQSMPEMTGIEFLGKTQDQFPQTLRILLTGYSEDALDETGTKLKAANIFQCITKPWSPDDLKNTLLKAVEIYQQSKS